MKKHIHKIAIDLDGTRKMDDNGYWVCKCGATTFPNCPWFEKDNKSKYMKKIIRTNEKDIDKIRVDPPKPKKNTKCWLCKKEIKKEFYWNGHFWHEKCKRKDSDKRIKKYLKRNVPAHL